MSTTAVPQSGTDATAGAWDGFVTGPWCDGIDVRDFIQRNYTPYTGDSAFLAGPTERTTGVWATLSEMFPAERAKGVYDIDNHTPSTIVSHEPGYIDQPNELIVGLQTDAPLKRAMIPNGGWRMVEKSLETYGYEVDPDVAKIFSTYRKTHNDGVFDVYPRTTSPWASPRRSWRRSGSTRPTGTPCTRSRC
jgi:formate C-acetyltransferase